MTNRELANHILTLGRNGFNSDAEADKILLNATILIQKQCKETYYKGFDCGVEWLRKLNQNTDLANEFEDIFRNNKNSRKL